MLRLAVGLFVVAVWYSLARGQEKWTEHTLKRGPSTPPGTAEIESFKFLSGHWTGQALGGMAEEIWSPAYRGEMIGMFRAVRDGQPAFYELMSIREKDGGLQLRIKHFDREFKGWEAQDQFEEFVFLAERDGAMYFDGLTFAPRGPDQLTIYVAAEEGQETHELQFDFRRVSTPDAPPAPAR
jgi:hypothetical protein